MLSFFSRMLSSFVTEIIPELWGFEGNHEERLREPRFQALAMAELVARMQLRAGRSACQQ